MATKWPQGEITPNIPASVLGGNNISGVYTLDQLNRLNADFGPQMQKSLRFRSSASAYLSRTPSVAGNQQKFSLNLGVKRGVLGASETFFYAGGNSTYWFALSFNASNQLQVVATTNAGATAIEIYTNAVFRDPSAWYLITIVVDTTNATAANRVLIYANGVSQSLAITTSPTQNQALSVNSAVIHTFGVLNYASTSYFDGYMADINFIDGLALDPSYFGKYNATTGVWQPSFYTGAYGTNGFHLTFANNASTTTLGYDSSGNGNNWTTNNISLTAGSTYDSMQDVPTNWTSGDPVQARGNYAVLNPLSAGRSINSANLQYGGSATGIVKGTIAVSSGKWYWEYQYSGGIDGALIGIAPSSVSPTITFLGTTGTGTGYGYYSGTGSKYGGSGGQAYGASWGTSDVIGVALDMDAGTLTFYKNNVSQGVAFSSLSGEFVAACGNNTTQDTGAINFGQRPFAYTPPTGYKTLCTQNLPAVTIYNGAQYMAATLYTGNGATQSIVNAVNGVSFQPDFVWGKDRSTARSNSLVDSVRGVTNTLLSNATDAEYPYVGLTAFNANGFSVGSHIGLNAASDAYVAWQWKAGGTAVTNTAGTITSSVSANTTAGFSVVTYTGNAINGATVGHGLGAAPAMFIIKKRSSTSNWTVYHQSLTANGSVFLNLTDAYSSDPTRFNNTAPTSTVFTIGSPFEGNTNGATYVTYCFAAIPGYSAFGSYTGNGSSDGPFVYCGFRPRFILIKGTGVTHWQMFDTSRSTYNAVGNLLLANTSDAEYAQPPYLDALSNGFKLRGTGAGQSGADYNMSGSTYIYAAFAENPFNYSLAR